MRIFSNQRSQPRTSAEGQSWARVFIPLGLVAFITPTTPASPACTAPRAMEPVIRQVEWVIQAEDSVCGVVEARQIRKPAKVDRILGELRQAITGRFTVKTRVGYDTPTTIGGSASELAAPLWGWWMKGIHDGLAERKFEGPEIEYRQICTITGLRRQTGEGCLSIRAPFLPGTAPRGVSTVCAKPEPEKKFVSMWRRRKQADDGRGSPPPGSSGQATGKSRATGPEPF